MSFYSGNGDDGTTRILKAEKISKADTLIDTLGAIDEASAAISWAKQSVTDMKTKEILAKILRDLADIMAEIAGNSKKQITQNDQVVWLENQINQLGEGLQQPRNFIYDFQKEASARLNITRTLVRRAERGFVIMMKDKKDLNKDILTYLNRLSSLIYLIQIKQELI